jgi:hypothetical protein
MDAVPKIYGSAISGPIMQFENKVYAIDNLPLYSKRETLSVTS